ncbi:MAG: TonB-dependent receptor, partial [Vicinamibacterales bacterium]
QWNVSAQQALGKAQSVTVSYVGSAARDLYRKNRYSAPNPTFTSSIYLTGNSGYSDYNSLQVKFDRRLSKGLQALVSYTWSHSQDNASDDQSYIAVAPTAFFDPNVDYGDSDNDVRHVVSGALTYQIPSVFTSGVGHALLSDWSIDGLFNARSAPPVFILGGSVSSGGVVYAPRPNVVPGVPVYLYGSQYPGGTALNKAAFSNPGSTQGNLERNSIRGFGAWQADLALHRQFHLTKSVGLQFRAEVFNVFNHTNFGPPAQQGSANNNITSATFGLATQTLGNSLGGLNPIFQFGGPRSGQFAVRLQF